MTFTIEQLEALKEGTTPGPWEWRVGEKVAYRHELVDENGISVLACGALRWPDEPDESLIAASPALLDQLIATEAELQQLKEQIENLADWHDVKASKARVYPHPQEKERFIGKAETHETARNKLTEILEGNA